MKAHVKGQLTLGQLRQALLAVFSGNPLFSPEEQLQRNHAAHEADDVATLTAATRAALRSRPPRPRGRPVPARA